MVKGTPAKRNRPRRALASSRVAEARALAEHGAWAGAIAKFRQVLARNPFHLAALENEALAHDKLGESEEAERCRRRAGKLRQESFA